MDPRAVTAGYRALSAAAQRLPEPLMDALVAAGARAAMKVSPSRRLLAERNLRRVHQGALSDRAAATAVRVAFETYGQYWADSFRLPGLSATELDAGLSWSGFRRIREAVDGGGPGPIMVIPHLGGWEWAGFWMTQVEGLAVTAVVERVEPPELFDFFTEFRERLGLNVVPLGPRAGSQVLAAIRRGDVLCLMADRDIDGTGIEVEFFGERTTLPPGPATLALRTGAPLLPTAVYFTPHGHHCEVQEAVPAERRGKLRADVTRVTQELAHRLEGLVSAAPEQWHMMQPNWPSDEVALAAAGLTPSDP
jgi:KDO2-lipid IV(A) lauroyltransferase